MPPDPRWFLYQLLLSVKYMHSGRILHRDIKPANVLLSEACDVRLCDFGLARSLDAEHDDNERDQVGIANPRDVPPHLQAVARAAAGGACVDSALAAAASGGGDVRDLRRQFTKHVVTRWYRAPELPLYNDGHYTAAIDMWSVGCVYAEMLGMLDTGNAEDRHERKALFPGGACYPMSRDVAAPRAGQKEKKDQLSVILEVLGSPTPPELERVRTQDARDMLAGMRAHRAEDLSKRFPTAPAEAIDLLRSMLRFNPEDRISVDGALAHPFLASVRRPHDEVSRTEGPLHFGSITPENIRVLMVDEVCVFRAPGCGRLCCVRCLCVGGGGAGK